MNNKKKQSSVLYRENLGAFQEQKIEFKLHLALKFPVFYLLF